MPLPPMTRRHAVLQLSTWAALAAAPAAWAATPAAPASRPIPVQMWKDPHCGCCQDWVAHMQAHGFAVTAHDSAQGNAAMRAQLGLPAELGSCHTALVQGYVLEGHVPAQDVHRLLAQKPKALGLAVPGMPVGSPGMDGPVYQGRVDPYEVLLVTPRWLGGVQTRVFSRYPA